MEPRSFARTLLGKPTPFVGRAKELTALAGVLGESIAGRVARAVLVTGDAGVGKSRLGEELVRAVRARADAPEVWIARGDPMRASSPFGMLRELVRAGLAARDLEPRVVD